MRIFDFDADLALNKFQEYLRIRTNHPNPDYKKAIEFLKQYAKELELEINLVEIGSAERLVALMTIPGKRSDLPSILLNSHMDVSCADYESWEHDPWAAYKDSVGNIHGVGAQDMKCVGIQYLEAVRILTQIQKEKFERTIHISFVPDEQINDGTLGMKLFIDTPEFRQINVGLALDEGLANPLNKYSVYYGERNAWWVRVKCRGSGGHASRITEEPAAVKIQRVITSFLNFRKKEIERLNRDSSLCLGNITSVELTKLEGGSLPNAVPAEFSAVFDLRIPPTEDLLKFEEMIAIFCQEAGDGVTFEFLNKYSSQTTTSTEEIDPWWSAFTRALHKCKVEFSKEIHPAFSDGRFLRELGISVIGFSPIKNTPIALFTSDEYLPADVFLDGIKVYCAIIREIANVTK